MCPVTVREAKQLWEETKSGMDFSDAEGELVVDINVAPNVYDKEVAEAMPATATALAAAVDGCFISEAASVIGQ